MKLICKLVGVQNDDTFEMEINGSESVATFKRMILEKKKHEIHVNALDEVLLYLAKKKDQEDGKWLDDDVLDALSSSQVASMCTRMHDTQRLNSPKLLGRSVWLGDGVVHALVLISEVLPLQRTVVGVSKESSGKDWPYQGLSELAAVVTDPLVGHYQAWQNEFYDKQTHSLFLVVSGPGTGKSRMLDEMKSLVCEAAKRSKKQDLVERMENAFVFNITFGGDTAATGKLLDYDCPEFDISYRMLYQLAKERKPWTTFVYQLAKSYPSFRLYMETVLDILAELKQISNVKDLTVVLCVEGLENLSSDGTMTCDYHRVLGTLCQFLNSSRAFAVCVCSTKVQKQLSKALAGSGQVRVYLEPSALRGEEILKPRTRLEQQLVDDMGGHGRALEVLQDVLQRHHNISVKEIDPATLVDEVYDALKTRYQEVFESRLFDDPTNCHEVMAAILSRQVYCELARIGRTDVTVDELRSLDLFRCTRERRLECAFVFFVILMKNTLQKIGEADDISQVPRWDGSGLRISWHFSAV